MKDTGLAHNNIPRCPCGSGLGRYALHDPTSGRFAVYACPECGDFKRARLSPGYLDLEARPEDVVQHD